MASVQERVIDIVASQLGVGKDQITHETSFINDLGADSLDTVELVMELEEEFDIQIPDEQAAKIRTVGEAIEYIEKEQAKKDGKCSIESGIDQDTCQVNSRNRMTGVDCLIHGVPIQSGNDYGDQLRHKLDDGEATC